MAGKHNNVMLSLDRPWIWIQYPPSRMLMFRNDVLSSNVEHELGTCEPLNMIKKLRYVWSIFSDPSAATWFLGRVRSSCPVRRPVHWFYCLFINIAVIAQVLLICFIGGRFLHVCIMCPIDFMCGVYWLYYLLSWVSIPGFLCFSCYLFCCAFFCLFVFVLFLVWFYLVLLGSSYFISVVIMFVELVRTTWRGCVIICAVL